MRQRESLEGRKLMQWAWHHQNQRPELAWLFHIPNGGDRHRVVAAKLKAEGVKRGVADYFLPVPIVHNASGEMWSAGLWIELKAPGNTYPTPEQRSFLQAMQDAGYEARWCRGADEAIEVIQAYLDTVDNLPGRTP